MKYIAIIVFFFVSINLFCNDYFDESSKLIFNFYRDYMSPIRSSVSQCQFNPSCSEFAKESIKEYGIAKGIILSADRLIRCSGGRANPFHYPFRNGRYKDSPSNNFLFGEGNMWKLGFASTAPPDLTILNDNTTIDTVFNFSYYLFQQKNFFLSSLELQRICFYSKNNTINKKANLLLALNEFTQQHYIKSLEYLDSIDVITNSKLKFNYFILKYIVSDNQNLNLYNVNLCNKYINEFDKQLLFKLQIYSSFKDHELIIAFDANDSLKRLTNNECSDSVKNFIQTKIYEKSKSPFLAGCLSTLIPGAGYIYTGQIKEGLSAFVINALLGIGIYSLFKNHNTGSGILTSLVVIPFYFGNIVGSANSAEVENNKLFQVNLNNLRNLLNIDFYFSFEYLNNLWK